MTRATAEALRGKLTERRRQLDQAIHESGPVEDLVRLVQQVDAALSRMDVGEYGRCRVCHTDIEDHDLLANPYIEYCLCELSTQQQKALQQDLDLARRIQGGLLPLQDLVADGWRTHYRYQPAGPVSGDYCDLVPTAGGDLYFSVADVAGKGVSAALLTAHLNASFRSLIEVGLPLQEIVERQNHLLLGSTLPSHYATLVSGRAGRDGKILLCNAGHVPPQVIRRDRVDSVAPTGFPVGMVEERRYGTVTLTLDPGDTLFICTDGLIEARDPSDEEFGSERLADLLQRGRDLEPRALADECLGAMRAFLQGRPAGDDVSLLVVRRES